MRFNTDSNNRTNKKNKNTRTHRYRPHNGGCQREARWGLVKGKKGQILETEDLIFGGGLHTMEFTDNES